MAYNQDRRNALARERGFANYQAERNAKSRARGFQSYSVERRVMRDNRPEQRPERVDLGGGQANVYTRNESKLAAAIRDAAANDMRITARVTMIDADGNKVEVELWSKGGWRAETAADYMDAQGGAFALIADQLSNVNYAVGAVVDVELRVAA